MLYIASERFVTVDQVRADDNCGCVTATTPDSDTLVDYIDAASDMIALATGLRVAGQQQVIARPCRKWHTCEPCSCCGLDVIPLGPDRIKVNQVKIDGVTLASDYWFLKWHLTHWGIARRPLDGETTPRMWPSSQKLYLEDTAEDTFAIYFTQGIAVDTYIIEAAALEIVCDLIAEDRLRNDYIPGATEVTLGGTSIRVDPEYMERIQMGAVGPMAMRMMGLMAPGGMNASQVWAPELLHGWVLGLEINGWTGWGS